MMCGLQFNSGSEWSSNSNLWKMPLNPGLRRIFRWVFVLPVCRIIGANYLHYYNLLVDMMNSRLVATITQLRVQGRLQGTGGLEGYY